MLKLIDFVRVVRLMDAEVQPGVTNLGIHSTETLQNDVGRSRGVGLRLSASGCP